MRRRIILNNISTNNFVDLGLPSGILWAKCDIGAENEYDVVNYFQWGDIVPLTYGDTLPDYNSTPGASLSGKIPANATYDAAVAIVGNGCRMPTAGEIQELIDNTDYQFTTINSMNGGKFMKKTDHDVYIFIPAAGYIWDRTSRARYGERANLRTSFSNGSSNSTVLQIDSSGAVRYDYTYRSYACNVRPVFKPIFSITITLNPIDGTSASGISVTVTDSDSISHSGTTNSNGVVRLTGVANGSATVSALDSRYMVATKTITISNIDKSFTIDCRYAPIGVYIDTTDYSLISAEDWSTQGVGKTANGVAVITETHAFVIHLTSEAYTKIYSTNTTPCSGITAYGETSARSYLNGIGDTYLMAASYGSGTTYAAGYAISTVFPNGKHGYMGSVGELVLVKDNKTDIDSCLSACNGATWKNDHYWSSTYRGTSSNKYTFWEYRVRDDSLNYNTTIGDHYVRPFCELI